MDRQEAIRRVEMAQKELLLAEEALKEEKTYSIGDRFVYEGDKYLLAQIGTGKVTMVNLASGNRFGDAVAIFRPGDISSQEFCKIVPQDEFVRYWNATEGRRI